MDLDMGDGNEGQKKGRDRGAEHRMEQNCPKLQEYLTHRSLRRKYLTRREMERVEVDPWCCSPAK